MNLATFIDFDLDAVIAFAILAAGIAFVLGQIYLAGKNRRR